MVQDETSFVPSDFMLGSSCGLGRFCPVVRDVTPHEEVDCWLHVSGDIFLPGQSPHNGNSVINRAEVVMHKSNLFIVV